MAPNKPKLDAPISPCLGWCRQHNESIQRYRRLQEANPKDAVLLNNLAFTLMESGDLATAETEFRKALTIEPKNENAAVNLGLLLARQKRYLEALAILTPAVGPAAAHHNLAS